MSVGKKELTESVAIDNPTLFTVTVLKEILESKGIRVNGNPVDADELKDSLKYDNVQQLASFTSVPYSVMVEQSINKVRTFIPNRFTARWGRKAPEEDLWRADAPW
jgi:D-alanyl-D-alanine carboxypeptidase